LATQAATKERAARLRAAGALIPNLLSSHHEAACAAASFDKKRVQGATSRLLGALATDMGAEGCMVVLEAAGMPKFFVGALLHAAGCKPDDVVSVGKFSAAWDLVDTAQTLEAALVALLLCRSSGSSRTELRPVDMRPLVAQVLIAHPGLDFLADADNAFSARYIDTVVARLFYDAGRTGTEVLTAADLLRTGFVNSLWQLEECTDINSVRQLWSYEHFYVLYTTFWKLDAPEHGLELSRDALLQ
jgi:hypothetical protein